MQSAAKDDLGYFVVVVDVAEVRAYVQCEPCWEECCCVGDSDDREVGR